MPLGFVDVKVCAVTDVWPGLKQLDKLLELTERYCVVLQTLRAALPVRARLTQGG